MSILKRLFKRESVGHSQTTFCFCPKCENELVGSNSLVDIEDLVTYRCSNCSHVSEWLFDAPVPILTDDLRRGIDK